MGGKSERMGYLKENILMEDKRTFLQHITEEMSEFNFKFLSVNSERQYHIDGWQTIVDTENEIGPMGGIYSVLKAVPKEVKAVLFIAVDMPNYDFKEAHAITQTYRGEDAFIAVAQGMRQPLASVYSPACIPVIEELIKAKNYKMTMLLNSVKSTEEYYSIRHACYRNVNSEEDLIYETKR